MWWPRRSAPRPGRRRAGCARSRRAPRTAPRTISKISRATSVLVGIVRDRLTVRKSASRTLIATVRPTWPLARSRAPTLSARASRLRRQQHRVGHVDVEGHLGADRLLHLLGRRPGAGRGPRRARAGGPPTASPSAPRSMPTGAWASSPTVVRPSRRSVSAARSPTPQSASTGSGCRKSSTRAAGHDDHAVGLGAGRAELGHELGRRDPDRAGQPLLGEHPLADARRRSRRAGRAAAARRRRRGTPRRSESGSTSGVTSRKIRMTASEAAAIAGAVDRQEDRLRAERPGPRRRHGAAHPEPARLVAGRAHHAARPDAADHDRLAAQLGPGPDRHRGEERIHVDVQDRAARVVGLRPETRVTPPRHRLAPSHVSDSASPDPPDKNAAGQRAISSGTVISAAVTEPW